MRNIQVRKWEGGPFLGCKKAHLWWGTRNIHSEIAQAGGGKTGGGKDGQITEGLRRQLRVWAFVLKITGSHTWVLSQEDGVYFMVSKD